MPLCPGLRFGGINVSYFSGGPAPGEEEVTRNEEKAHLTTHIDDTRPINDEICATCFACGRGYCKSDGRFCSTRCREAFDAGLPPYDHNYVRAMTDVPLSAWRIIAGPPGIEIGARFYERQKVGDGPIVRAPKKRRKFAKQINGLRRHLSDWSVSAKAARRACA